MPVPRGYYQLLLRICQPRNWSGRRWPHPLCLALMVLLSRSTTFFTSLLVMEPLIMSAHHPNNFPLAVIFFFITRTAGFSHLLSVRKLNWFPPPPPPFKLGSFACGYLQFHGQLMGRDIWYAQRNGSFTLGYGNWWQIHLRCYWAIRSPVQGSYCSQFCSRHWDEAMAGLASFASPKVLSLLPGLKKWLFHTCAFSLLSEFEFDVKFYSLLIRLLQYVWVLYKIVKAY